MGKISDLSPGNTVADPTTGVEVNIITEDGLNKMLTKSSIVPEGIGDLFFLHAENGGSKDMNVDGSTTTQTFSILAESGVGAKDLVVSEMKFSALDANIKIGNFLGENGLLSVGILVRVVSGGITFVFNVIQTTADFEAHFEWGPGSKFNMTFDNPNDAMSATFSPDNPFVLFKDSGDKIEVEIRDNLTGVELLHFETFGFKDDG